MSESENRPVQSSMPLWGRRILPILLVTLVTAGVVGKVAGLQPFAESAWFGLAVASVAMVYFAVSLGLSARPVSDTAAAPEDAIHSGWQDHATAGCFVLFLGIITVTAIWMLLDDWLS